MHNDKDKPESSPSPDEDMVVTPAGPVKRRNVRSVAPGQVVRRKPDGTYEVVDKPAPK
jgi:hypothetical protein